MIKLQSIQYRTITVKNQVCATKNLSDVKCLIVLCSLDELFFHLQTNVYRFFLDT